MIEPIKPDEVDKKLESIPDEVIESFNEMITKKWDGHSSKFKQDDIVNIILTKMNIKMKSNSPFMLTSRYLFDNKFLDVEDIYRKQGWTVVYDAPAYSETYAAIFEFSK